MAIKFLHTADLHLDTPFEALDARRAALRREEQRGLLRQIAALAEGEDVDLILLAGDLLDSAASYYETYAALAEAFAQVPARVFIAPGNHDFYSPESPYAFIPFSDNVHIFRSGTPECVPLPDLGCRIWGAAFTDRYAPPLLSGFSAPGDGTADIMVLHGDLAGDVYNPVTREEIAASGLTYLALGHVHTYSGSNRAGGTVYAYPGCPEGRGFDETGARGVILGQIDDAGCRIRFHPLDGRQYRLVTVDLTGCESPRDAVAAALSGASPRDIVRVILTGEYDGVYIKELEAPLKQRFFEASLRDETRPALGLWAGCGEDTLRGIFLRNMRARLDAAGAEEKDSIVRAVRFGLAALDGREEPFL